MKPFLLIISAPTGAGKTTIAKALADARPESVAFSISATTRDPRPGEQDGRDYFFLRKPDFEHRRARGDFLEWAEYSGNLYGTLLSEVDRITSSGRHVLLDIEVQGARKIRERRHDLVSIFVLPPSVAVLLERLKGRGEVPPKELRSRLQRAVEEFQAAAEYDYIVVNDDRDQAIRDVASVLDAENLRGERVLAAQQLREELQRVASQMSA
ncbi:MAG: guanylate kinase [Gemmatimonadetes bacterium]|nr:guanylate kinase [Gemmatimonadota bacterium]